jgi:hypothetical protein
MHTLAVTKKGICQNCFNRVSETFFVRDYENYDVATMAFNHLHRQWIHQEMNLHECGLNEFGIVKIVGLKRE